MRARSGAPLSLRPQAVAAARKPGARSKLSGSGGRVEAFPAERISVEWLIERRSVAETSLLTPRGGSAEALPVGSDRGRIHPGRRAPDQTSRVRRSPHGERETTRRVASTGTQIGRTR